MTNSAGKYLLSGNWVYMPEGESWISAWLREGTVITHAYLLFPGEGKPRKFEMPDGPIEIPEDGSYAIGVKDDGSDACIIPWALTTEQQRIWSMHSTHWPTTGYQSPGDPPFMAVA